jgi:hypothetical protein
MAQGIKFSLFVSSWKTVSSPRVVKPIANAQISVALPYGPKPPPLEPSFVVGGHMSNDKAVLSEPSFTQVPYLH